MTVPFLAVNPSLKVGRLESAAAEAGTCSVYAAMALMQYGPASFCKPPTCWGLPPVCQHPGLLCSEDRLVAVLALLKSGAIKGRGCMFVEHSQGAHRLRMFLDNFGVRAALCHDAMPVNAREHAVEVQPCLTAAACACAEPHSSLLV